MGESPSWQPNMAEGEYWGPATGPQPIGKQKKNSRTGLTPGSDVTAHRNPPAMEKGYVRATTNRLPLMRITYVLNFFLSYGTETKGE